MKEKIVLIKGPYCFVFNKETDQAPKYAIALAHMTTTTQPSPARDGQFPVTIETSMGDAEWELIFQKKNIAKQFVASFKQQAAVGEADEVRKVRISTFADCPRWTGDGGGDGVRQKPFTTAEPIFDTPFSLLFVRYLF